MPLPDFILAGAQKSGTTTLWAMLNQHPAIHLANPKELHFFDRHYGRGTAWYSACFCPSPGERVLGEATPIYMTDHIFRKRMHAVVPDARMLVMLREPAARAYSHYWMMRAKRSEDQRTFESALDAEDERWNRSKKLTRRWRFAYLRRGHYAEQLEGLEHFFGRSRIHVVIMEEFLDKPQEIMGDVCEFLGVDAAEGLNMKLEHRKNSRDHLPALRGYPPMSRETRAKLRSYFAPLNAELEDWLGRRLTTWAL